MEGGDDSANVYAHGVYDPATQTWGIVLWRSLVSTDAADNTDVNFYLDEVIPFSVAVTDNSSSRHHGVTGPIWLGFSAE